MNKNLLPKLRFPEFQDSGEWKEKTIGKISESVIAGGTPSTSQKDYWNGNIRWMNSGELNYKRVYEVQGRITEKGLQNSSTKIIPSHCVLIGLAGQGKTRGTVAMNMIELCTNQSIAAIFPNEQVYYSDFLYHNLDNRYDELRRISAGGEGRGGLNLQIIKSLKIILPLLPEQQKIADCLTSLDDLITAQSQKVEALQTYKKGLMQNLFPAEGESVPRLRLPEFQSAGEWEEKTIGELGDVFMCKRIFAEETNSSDGVPFFKIGTLGGKPDAFISKELFDEYKSKYNYPRKGEILITCSGTVGKCLAYDGSDAYYQDSNIVWIDNPTLEISNEFLRSVLLNVDWGSLNSTTITRIYMSDLRDLSILFPANQKEQQRITELLSALDEQISAQGEALAALKVHKKGLMQGLFPKETSEVLKTSEV